MFQHHVEERRNKLRNRFPEARIEYGKRKFCDERWYVQYTDGHVIYTDVFMFINGKMILDACYDDIQRSK